MQARSLNRKIEIQTKAATQDEYGEEVITWTTIATPRATITPLRGKERIEAAQVSPEQMHQIRIRYRALEITPKMRIKYTDPVTGDRIFHIKSVINVTTRNRAIEFLCEEQVDE